MTAPKHFSELSADEVRAMQNACIEAAIKYAQKINMSGLSHHGCHNLYTAIQDAITLEWHTSKVAYKKPRRKSPLRAEWY